jgi:hypothetical protein
MKREPKREGVLLAVLAAALVGCTHGSGARETPPAVDSSAWSWAAAAPGVNIYVASQGTARDSRIRSVWVDRRYFSNLAGVSADVIDLWRFDCRHDRSRPWSARDDEVRGGDGAGGLEPGSSAVSDRVAARAESANQQVLEMVCGRRPGQ